MPTPAQEIQAQVSKELSGFVTIIGNSIPSTYLCLSLYPTTRLSCYGNDRAILGQEERKLIVIPCWLLTLYLCNSIGCFW